MKKVTLEFLAFVGVLILALLEIFGFLASKDILTLSGGLINLLETVKNVCILLVVGITAFGFVKGKGKGLLITYFVAMCIVVICTILLWIKF